MRYVNIVTIVLPGSPDDVRDVRRSNVSCAVGLGVRVAGPLHLPPVSSALLEPEQRPLLVVALHARLLGAPVLYGPLPSFCHEFVAGRDRLQLVPGGPLRSKEGRQAERILIDAGRRRTPIVSLLWVPPPPPPSFLLPVPALRPSTSSCFLRPG